MNIERPSALAAIRLGLEREAAVVLLGPRQVGKTTLAREIAAAQDGALYLDLETPADRRKLEDTTPFLTRQFGHLTVIDEVHYVPHLFAELRGLIDTARRAGQGVGQFLLLGSASLDLLQKTAESLAGRVTYLDLGPIGPMEAQAAGIGMDQLWLRGGFPRSLLAGDDSASLAWRHSFIRSYLERDVPMFAPRLPGAMIGRLWTMLAHAQGTMLNSARLAQGLAVSAPMVVRYIDLLVDLLLVRRLQPWSGNLGKRLIRTPKIYVRDAGLVHALLDIESINHLLGHPVVGSSWVGFVIEALIAAAGPGTIPMYYRTRDGAEIDLVLERAGRVAFAIEVKRGTAPRVEPGFHIACDDVKAARRIVVHGGEESYPAAHGAEVMSLPDAIAAVTRG